MEYQWQSDGSLVFVTRETKRINGELVEDAQRVQIPQDYIGRLRHILALGPPPRQQAEQDGNKVAGEEKLREVPEKVAGAHERGPGV